MKSLNLPSEEDLTLYLSEYEQYAENLTKLLETFRRSKIDDDTTLYFELIEFTEKRSGHIWFSYHEKDQQLVDKINLCSDDFHLGKTGVTRKQVENIINTVHYETEHMYGDFVSTNELESFIKCEECQQLDHDGFPFIGCRCGDSE